jgi:hypothetical protein
MMTPAGFEQAARALLQRQPFHPFAIEFDYGDRFVVDRPEALRVYAGAGLYIHPDDTFDFVDAEVVREFVDLPPASST